jgi:hypothetical protein
MAYRCNRYAKILVGPKKTCEARCGKGLEDACDYRSWQEGVLKAGGRRARTQKPAERDFPMVFAFDAQLPSGEKMRVNYLLGDDGSYHYFGRDPTEPLTIFPVLTKEDLALAKECKWNYRDFVENMVSKRLQE